MLQAFRKPKAPMKPSSPLEVPEFSSGRILTIDEIESAVLREIAAYWFSLRGARLFPSRSDIAPKDLRRLLPHVTVLRVVDDGADYEYRIMGDVQVHAIGKSFSGLKLSDVAREFPKFGEGLKLLLDGTRSARQPFGHRCWIGRDQPEVRFGYKEGAFLPLGPADDTVDHILMASVIVPRSIPPRT